MCQRVVSRADASHQTGRDADRHRGLLQADPIKNQSAILNTQPLEIRLLFRYRHPRNRPVVRLKYLLFAVRRRPIPKIQCKWQQTSRAAHYAALRGRPTFLAGTLPAFAFAGIFVPVLRPSPIFFASAERFEAYSGATIG